MVLIPNANNSVGVGMFDRTVPISSPNEIQSGWDSADRVNYRDVFLSAIHTECDDSAGVHVDTQCY